MTETDYIATAARSGKPFTFTRIRTASGSTTSQEFLPGEGTLLTFASRATDTLEIVGVPSGFLAAGDVVTVAYLGTTVFRGDVDRIIDNLGRGDDATQTVIVTGPWAKMSRLVMRQLWRTGSSGSSLSSRLILNQATDGTNQTVNVALREICWGPNNTAPAACGYSLTQQTEETNIDVSGTIKLPFDECRDITIADAIRRELRLFPAAVSFFDYSTATPTIKIQMPDVSGNDAAYVASIPKTVRQYTYNSHPIDGVDLEIETSDSSGNRTISHQTAGSTSTDNPNCLYSTVQLAGPESSAVTKSLTFHTESFIGQLSSKNWWKSKHPRLAKLSTDQFTISDPGHSGVNANPESGSFGSIVNYNYICDCSVEQLAEFGINAAVETFHCVVTVTSDANVEQEIYLSMEFVTTDTDAGANGRTVTRTMSSTATSGESVPSGLATAILAARSGTLLAESFTMRLGTAAQWPTIGDICDHLILQKFTVDCASLTADLEFGVPDYLSPEDMAALLTNFRNKRRATLSSSRISGKATSGQEATVKQTPIKPLSSSEWIPGIKSKTTMSATVSGSTVSSGAGYSSIVSDTTGTGAKLSMYSQSKGTLSIDADDIPADDVIKVRKLTIIGANNSQQLVHIPMCRDVTLNLSTSSISVGGGGANDGGGGGDNPTPTPIPVPSGGSGGGMFAWDESTQTIGVGGCIVGRQWVTATGTGSGKADGFYQLKVTLTASGATAEVVSGVNLGTSPNGNVSYIPIYTVSGGKVTADYRGSFVTPVYE